VFSRVRLNLLIFNPDSNGGATKSKTEAFKKNKILEERLYLFIFSFLKWTQKSHLFNWVRSRRADNLVKYTLRCH